MTNDMAEDSNVEVDELVVLKKFEGDSTHPDDEIERLTVQNGDVVAHDIIREGEVVGPVPNSELLGKNIGRLVT